MFTGKGGKSLEEASLIAQCILGDERAWGDLVERYQSALLRSIRIKLLSFFGKKPPVEGIGQEVWLALLEHNCARLKRYDPLRGSFDTFLRVIANQIIEKNRQHAVHEVPLGDIDPGRFSDDGLVNAELGEIAERPSPEESFFLREYLMGIPQSSTHRPLSPGYQRILKHRIRRKMMDLFELGYRGE